MNFRRLIKEIARLRLLHQGRSALKTDARLLPSGAGEFADFTVRAGALLKGSATVCIGTGSIRKRPLANADFSASFSSKHARCLLPPTDVWNVAPMQSILLAVSWTLSDKGCYHLSLGSRNNRLWYFQLRLA